MTTNRFYFLHIVFLTMTIFVTTACSNLNEPKTEDPFVEHPENNLEAPVIPKTRVDIKLTESEKLLTKQSADFSIRLLQSANKTFEENEQIILSPLSASFALSMLTNGVAGETLKEMLSTLGFNNSTLDDLNNFNLKLLTEMPELDNTTTIGIANSLWMDKSFTPTEALKDILIKKYDAEVRREDFADTKTVDIINKWCEDKTNGLIKKFFEQLTPELQLTLLNAIYFKGGWINPFTTTTQEDFTNQDGIVKKVDLMHNTAYFLFHENDMCQMAELPYGNEAYSMMIVLPTKGIDIDDFIAQLNGESLLTWVRNMKSNKLNMRFPKFKLENKVSLRETLMALGMKKAFTSSDDFYPLSPEKINVSQVFQANYISVNEEGTEAAAITGLGMDGNPGIDESKPIDFHVNRPFLFFIKEKSTKTILFMGKIAKLN